jgi:Tfp pilus assembly protein PilX
MRLAMQALETDKHQAASAAEAALAAAEARLKAAKAEAAEAAGEGTLPHLPFVHVCTWIEALSGPAVLGRVTSPHQFVLVFVLLEPDI